MQAWYAINNVEEIDSPALLIFPKLIKKNICIAKEFQPVSMYNTSHVIDNNSYRKQWKVISRNRAITI